MSGEDQRSLCILSRFLSLSLSYFQAPLRALRLVSVELGFLTWLCNGVQASQAISLAKDTYCFISGIMWIWLHRCHCKCFLLLIKFLSFRLKLGMFVFSPGENVFGKFVGEEGSSSAIFQAEAGEL